MAKAIGGDLSCDYGDYITETSERQKLLFAATWSIRNALSKNNKRWIRRIHQNVIVLSIEHRLTKQTTAPESNDAEAVCRIT